MNTDNLINWSELSKQLTGNPNNIRKNKIPNKYQSKVNLLLKYIEFWNKEEIIYSDKEVKNKLSSINLYENFKKD